MRRVRTLIVRHFKNSKKGRRLPDGNHRQLRRLTTTQVEICVRAAIITPQKTKRKKNFLVGMTILAGGDGLRVP